ncbi:hypothetical protein TNCV_1028591 [Trichonephila clavipes]|nr:hypothetical protein TNCV_1028591 [Trichonephila clavipes]
MPKKRMYGHANGDERAALRMNHAHFLDRRTPDDRIQRLHRQLREIRLFHVTRYDAGRRRRLRNLGRLLVMISDTNFSVPEDPPCRWDDPN